MNRGKIDRTPGVFFVSLLILSLCFSTAAVSQTGLTPLGTELQNTSYGGFAVTEQPVALKDGKWPREPYENDGAARPEIKLLAGTYPIADFNQDGSEDAAVLLSESGGESGIVYYLAVVEKKDGKLHNIATTMLGDSLQIVEFGAENGTIFVKVILTGANGPSELMTRNFTLKGNTLQEEEMVDKAERLSPDVMAGVTWVLAGWNRDEPASPEPEITLVYQNERFTGSSGCNRYFIDASAEEKPGSLMLGMIGATRMVCSPPVNAVENRFHELLAGVTGFSFDNSRLVLGYGEGGGAMFFTRKPDGPGNN